MKSLSSPPPSPTRPLSLALLPLAGLLLAGCGHPQPEAVAPPPAAVTVAPVEQRTLANWEELTGRTAAIEFVEIRPRVSGYIDQVRFESGQLVKKGDVLFRIDQRWAKADVARRDAELAVAQVRADNAEREAKRNEQLLASRAISREEAEGREARAAEARAALLAAKAAHDSAELDLELTEIRSPIDGRVSRAMVTTGNYISGVAGAATLLTTVVSVDPVYVYVDMDENAFLHFNTQLQKGALPKNERGQIPVQVQLADEDGFGRTGVVESLDNRLNDQTGSIVLRATLPNPDGRILPGLFARLRLPTAAQAPTLLVEETAIGTDQAQKFVLTLSSSNTAAYRPVKLGPLVDGLRVVREGLQPGEKIIVNGLARIRPGMPVTPQDRAAGTESGRETAQR